MITFPSHAAGAYLSLKFVDTLLPGLHVGTTPVLITGIVAGMISDVDGLFYIGRLRDHHDTPLHTPSFWMAVFVILSVANNVTHETFQPYITGSFIGVSSHLFLDWYAGRVAGLRVFYPFSKKRYSLFPLQRDKGVFKFDAHGIREYIKFYVSNRFLIVSEVLTVLVATALFFMDY